MSEATAAPAARQFLPALQGLRWFSALAVLGTHAAFLTGAGAGHWYQHLFSRLDLAVAVFFALSGFLLWRPHAGAARGAGRPPSALGYYRSRAARILPAYWVLVCVVLVVSGADARVWLANMTLTQPFVPLALTNGITQLWSLSVEVGFYVALPLIALALARLRGPGARWRILALMALAAVSLAWGFLPSAASLGNIRLWPPGYLPWFVAGMVLAELRADGLTLGSAARRWCLVVAVVAFGLECTPLGGPADLSPVLSWQFATKIVLGAVLAAALVAPPALAPSQSRHALLGNPVMLTLGQWSYGFFLWHLAVLTAVMPIIGFTASPVRMLLVMVVATVFTIGICAVNYAWVEEPAARFFGSRRAATPTTRPTPAPLVP